MSKGKWFLLGMFIAYCVALTTGMNRYQVGEPVPANVYTSPFEPDGIYKFVQTDFGEPNKPKIQAAPDQWIKQFGNNERTLLFYTISELRVKVAQQEQRILKLEGKDPNE